MPSKLTWEKRSVYRSADYAGLSAFIELEDSRHLLCFDDYSVPPTGFNSGVFSVIADPETTELDQGYLHYKSGEFQAKIGRQVITLDNHRFVGHVGFRQDRQTFDALSLSYNHGKEINLQFLQILKRNRIFASEKDIDSKDTLLNVAYNTKLGKLTGYVYLLEEDTALKNSNDTLGIRFSGASKHNSIEFLYSAELAKQKQDGRSKTDYIFLDVGAVLQGVTAKVGFESLGANAAAGAFSTPLATLHKFNGWTDQFLSTPTQGLNDLHISLSGKFGGGKWSATYHDFSTDVSAKDSDNLGNEFDLVYSRKFADHYSAGAKYGDYSAGAPSLGKVDTRKLWFWAGASF